MEGSRRGRAGCGRREAPRCPRFSPGHVGEMEVIPSPRKARRSEMFCRHRSSRVTSHPPECEAKKKAENDGFCFFMRGTALCEGAGRSGVPSRGFGSSSAPVPGGPPRICPGSRAALRKRRNGAGSPHLPSLKTHIKLRSPLPTPNSFPIGVAGGKPLRKTVSEKAPTPQIRFNPDLRFAFRINCFIGGGREHLSLLSGSAPSLLPIFPLPQHPSWESIPAPRPRAGI